MLSIIYALSELAAGRKFRYCAMILAGAFVHATILFALPLAFCAGKRNLIRSICILMTFLSIITFINGNSIPGIALLARVISASHKLPLYSTLHAKLYFYQGSVLQHVSGYVFTFCRYEGKARKEKTSVVRSHAYSSI